MKILLNLILCVTFFVNNEATASDYDKRENVPNFTEMFITDVVSLLPPEMQGAFGKKKSQLIAESNLAKLINAKNMYSIKQEVFIQKYFKTPDESGLLVWLNNSVEDVFRISFSSNTPDPFHEKFQNNLKNYFWRYINQNAVIDYKGYLGETTKEITETIYNSRGISEEGQKYSALVQLTTNLWVAAWKNSGGQASVVASLFERSPSSFSSQLNATRNGKKKADTGGNNTTPNSSKNSAQSSYEKQMKEREDKRLKANADNDKREKAIADARRRWDERCDTCSKFDRINDTGNYLDCERKNCNINDNDYKMGYMSDVFGF